MSTRRWARSTTSPRRRKQTLDEVNGVLDGIDPAEVRTALANIQKASENADKAAADIAKVTDKFANRADDIDQMIKDAKQLVQRLNDASVRVDGILAKVDTLLGSGEADGVMAEASDTLKSFKQVADTLNARLGTITDDLARFSGQGLQDVEALVQDSRRSINRIEEAVTDLSAIRSGSSRAARARSGNMTAGCGVDGEPRAVTRLGSGNGRTGGQFVAAPTLSRTVGVDLRHRRAAALTSNLYRPKKAVRGSAATYDSGDNPFLHA